jgi:chaperonin GroEL
MKEKKARVEDALHATRAAIEEGILPGGGVALARATAVLDKIKVEGEEKFGVDIIRQILALPLRQIAVNVGLEGGKVLNEVLSNSSYAYGYNARTAQYGDMIEMGVVDPKKVTRICLMNAASVAGTLLTTDVLVAKIPEKKKAQAGPGGGHGHGGPGGSPYDDMY